MSPRRIAAARVVWGGALLVAARSAPGDRLAPAAVAAVLGVRHLLQAALVLRSPAGALAARTWVLDAAHGASMLGLAAVSRRWRAAALADAAIATAWACATRSANRARQERTVPDRSSERTW